MLRSGNGKGTAKLCRSARAPAGSIDQGRARQKETNEHRSAVTHEDRCGIRVVNQKPQQRAREHGHHHCFGHLVTGQKVEGEKTRSDGRDSGGQTVHVVEQIDRVGNANQPEDRDQHIHRQRAGPRQD